MLDCSRASIRGHSGKSLEISPGGHVCTVVRRCGCQACLEIELRLERPASVSLAPSLLLLMAAQGAAGAGGRRQERHFVADGALAAAAACTTHCRQITADEGDQAISIAVTAAQDVSRARCQQRRQAQGKSKARAERGSPRRHASSLICLSPQA